MPWTSRRFCQVCESEFKATDLVPQVLVVFAALVTAATGLSWVSGLASGKDAGRQAVSLMQPAKRTAASETEGLELSSRVAPAPAISPEPPVQMPANNADLHSQAATITRSDAKVPVIESEPVYVCGAMTKKGTPCSRRVKGNVRCFQHTGMPSMLSSAEAKLQK